MSDVQALAEALVYLDGQKAAAPVDPEGRACILIFELARLGYVIRPPSGSPLQDRSPANLIATRRSLELRIEDVAREAGVSANTVRKVEDPNRRPTAPSIKAVAEALARLSAASAERR